MLHLVQPNLDKITWQTEYHPPPSQKQIHCNLIPDLLKLTKCQLIKYRVLLAILKIEHVNCHSGKCCNLIVPFVCKTQANFS